MIDIVFVCTGNTCRSPMAEGIFRRYHSGIDVASMGLQVDIPSKANPLAVQVCRDNGIDISSHIARGFNHKMLFDETHVLTMTDNHKKFILSQYPIDSHRVWTLKEYVGEFGDISDPYGGAIDEYKHCFYELERLIQKIKIMEE